MSEDLYWLWLDLIILIKITLEYNFIFLQPISKTNQVILSEYHKITAFLSKGK